MRRSVVRLTGLGVGVVGLQAATLAVVYRTPPELTGPLSGVFPPADLAPAASLASTARRRVEAETAAASRHMRDILRGLAAASWERRATTAPPAPTPRPPAAQLASLRLLVFGDSLATGVGCSPELGPELPAALASELAARLQRRVSWAVLGLTGASVEKMRTLLPSLRADVATNGAPAVVFILCGVNDWKYLVFGRTSGAFRTQLSSLVDEVRAVVGPDTLICLPALPLAGAVRFPAPLSYVVRAVGQRWDDQKRALSSLAAGGRVAFVDQPPLGAGEAAGLVCGDGIHPNERGYRRWAVHLAASVAGRLKMSGRPATEGAAEAAASSLR